MMAPHMPPAAPPKAEAMPPAPALPGGPEGGCGPLLPPPPPEEPPVIGLRAREAAMAAAVAALTATAGARRRVVGEVSSEGRSNGSRPTAAAAAIRVAVPCSRCLVSGPASAGAGSQAGGGAGRAADGALAPAPVGAQNARPGRPPAGGGVQ